MHFFRKSTVSRCAPTSRRLRLEPLEDRRMLAVFTVDNLDDSGAGSLRQAIDDANAAAGADVIEFQEGLEGTIALSTGELSITDELTIDGPGISKLTIDASDSDPTPREKNGDGSRIFHIDDGDDDHFLNVEIRGLTLTGGDVPQVGGAILSRENLKIVNSRILDNAAVGGSDSSGGAIFALGDVMISESTVSGNLAAGETSFGGGIYAHGNVTVEGSSRIIGNSASPRTGLFSSGASGGGIGSRGDVIVVDSFVLGNSAEGQESSGGGIAASGDMTVTRSTIGGNTATGTSGTGTHGGGIAVGGRLTIANSTISGNVARSASSFLGTFGGGISAFDEVTVTDSTIVSNSAISTFYGRASGGALHAYGQVFVSGSTISGNLASAARGIFGASGGAIWTSEKVTLTDSVMSGNSVIGPATHGGAIFARGDTTVSASEISRNLADGFAAFGGAINSQGRLTIAGSTIRENSAKASFTIATGGGAHSLGIVEIRDSTITGNSVTGRTVGDGGGIFSRAAVTVSQSSVSQNSTSSIGASSGGGIWGRETVSVQESEVLGNSVIGGTGVAASRGGGIRAEGDVTVSASSISENFVTTGFVSSGGGGIDADGDVTITGTSILGNLIAATSAGEGGGIRSQGVVTVTDSEVSGNSATGSQAGGGIFAGGDVRISRTSIAENTLVGDSLRQVGGGVAASGNVTIHQSTVFGNSVRGGILNTVLGGGVHSFARVTVTNSTISGNSALGDDLLRAAGGGIAAEDDITISSSTIYGNISFTDFDQTSGGGIFSPLIGLPDDVSIFIENSIVAGNVAESGPDIDPGSAVVTARHSLIGNGTRTGLPPAPVGMPDADGNLVGTAAELIDPLLGPLQDNGGPTSTHALLAGSPAIDAGDNTGAPTTDQRGFVRVVDGGSGQKIIDMGAYEFAATLAGDGNGDGHVGDEDYTVWANNFGLAGDDIPGDYNNDGVVGPQDYTVWANNFGAGTPPDEMAVSHRPVEPALQDQRDSDHSTFGFRHSSFDQVVAGLLTEPRAQGATGSASARGEGSAHPQQNRRPVEPALRVANPRPVEPALRTAHAAHDAAIPELMAEGFGRHDPISRSSIDHIWALLNAGLLENDSAEMLIDVSKRRN